MEITPVARRRANTAPSHNAATAFTPEGHARATSAVHSPLTDVSTPGQTVVGGKFDTPGGGPDDDMETWYGRMFASELKLNKKADRARRRSGLSLMSPASALDADDTPNSRRRNDELRNRGLGLGAHSSLDTLIDTMAVLGVFVDPRSSQPGQDGLPRLYVGDPMRASAGRARADTLRRSGSLSSLLDAAQVGVPDTGSPFTSPRSLSGGSPLGSQGGSLMSVFEDGNDGAAAAAAAAAAQLELEAPPRELEEALVSGGRELCPGLLSLPAWPGPLVETMASNDPRCVIFFGADSGRRRESEGSGADAHTLRFARGPGALPRAEGEGATGAVRAAASLEKLSAEDILDVLTLDSAPLLKCVVLLAAESAVLGDRISAELPHLFVLCFDADFKVRSFISFLFARFIFLLFAHLFFCLLF